MQGATKEWNEISLDTGCEYSPSCLACPLPICKYEMAFSTQLKIYRNVLIVREIEDNPDETHYSLAYRIGISRSIINDAWRNRMKFSQEVKNSIADSEFMKRLTYGTS